MPSIRISASKIAAAAGLNPYCRPDEIMKSVLEKHFPMVETETDEKELLFRAVDEYHIQSFINGARSQLTKRGQPNLIPEGLEPTLETVDACIEALGEAQVDETVTECEKREVASKTVLTENLGESPLAAILMGDLASKVATSRGVIKENTDLNSFEMRTGTKVLKRNSKFYTRTFNSKYNIIITGKVDGIDTQGRVVETKHRRRRLFGRIPEYEQVQMEVYMWLTGTKECTHIENFNGDSNTTTYVPSGELWQSIENGLNIFTNDLWNKVESTCTATA